MLLPPRHLPVLLPLLACLACTPTSSGGDDRGALGCEPRSCEQLDAQCGQASDGCGGLLTCGTCTAGEQCSGGTCRSACSPRTCAQVAATCGEVLDGCGGVLFCGECAAGEACGGGGPNRCGPSTCTPATCDSLGTACGPAADGCGGVLDCGACPEGSTCGGGGVPNVCDTGTCTPRTCASAGAECGTVADGCGGTLSCGGCGRDRACGGAGLSNVCLAPGVTPARVWVRTLAEPVTALATAADASVLLVLHTAQGAAPAKLDANGQVLWMRPGTSSRLSLHGLSVAPGSGELLAWGWMDGESGPGGAIAVRYSADGGPAPGLGACNDECSLGPYFASAEGSLLSHRASSQGSAIHHSRPDGTAWQLTHSYTQPSSNDAPLDYAMAAFDARGNVLVAATTDGRGHEWGRTFGARGETHMVVLELSPSGRFVWSRELASTRGRLHEVAVARDGSVVGLGEFGGTLRWDGDVLTTPRPGDLQTVLFSLDAGGSPRWLRALPFRRPLLALSPSGRIALAEPLSGQEDASCSGVRLAELDAQGRLLWADTVTPPGCTGSLGLRGLAYAGEQVVLGGTLRGTVDFGVGVGQADADGLGGFVLKLQSP